MKKISLTILSLMFLAAGLNSCSRGGAVTPEDEQPPADVLVGDWQLTHLDFSVMPSTGFPASDACIWEIVSGFEFRADSFLYIILGDDGFFDPYAKEYWTWSGDNDAFTVDQTNEKMPPYNFSLNPKNIKFEKTGDTWTVSFESDMSNGSTAKFKMKKQAINLDQNPAVTDPDGNDYECNFFGEGE